MCECSSTMISRPLQLEWEFQRCQLGILGISEMVGSERVLPPLLWHCALLLWKRVATAHGNSMSNWLWQLSQRSHDPHDLYWVNGATQHCDIEAKNTYWGAACGSRMNFVNIIIMMGNLKVRFSIVPLLFRRSWSFYSLHVFRSFSKSFHCRISFWQFWY